MDCESQLVHESAGTGAGEAPAHTLPQIIRALTEPLPSP